MQFQRDERVERRRARRRQVRRRRVAAVFILAGVGVMTAASTTSIFGTKPSTAETSPAPAIELPRGGTQILPNYRVVAYYGSASTGEDTRLGVLGTGSPTEVAERLADTAGDYDSFERPVLPAFELIATIAHDFPTKSGNYSSRLPDEVIDRYLVAARQEKAILILDIQPGRAKFMDEVRAYRKYLEMPDVSLALDPEWAMGPGEIPGKVLGHTDATTINEVSAYLDGIVTEKKLPQKLLIVHQFTEGMVVNERALVQRPGIAMVFNVDGFGTPEAKTAKYLDLTSDAELPSFLFHGFKLFYEEDADSAKLGPSARLMTPFEALDLDPSPDVVVYE